MKLQILLSAILCLTAVKALAFDDSNNKTTTGTATTAKTTTTSTSTTSTTTTTTSTTTTTTTSTTTTTTTTTTTKTDVSNGTTTTTAAAKTTTGGSTTSPILSTPFATTGSGEVSSTSTTTTFTEGPSKDSDYNHNLVVSNSSGTCLRMDFDKLFFSVGKTSINATGAQDTKVSGSCFDWIQDPQTMNYTLAASVSTTYEIEHTTLEVKFTFLQNATYTAANEHSYASGDKSSALSLIEVGWKNKNNSDGATFTKFGDYDFAMDEGVSYKCKYNFTYSTNETLNSANKAKLTIYNVHVQPFIPKHQEGFSKTNDNSYCPRDDTEVKRIGLIVGGILTGIALLGIVIFSITACRPSSSGYQQLSD